MFNLNFEWKLVKGVEQGPSLEPGSSQELALVLMKEDLLAIQHCLIEGAPFVLFTHFKGILPKGPYLPCVSMAGRALFAGYPRFRQRQNGHNLADDIFKFIFLNENVKILMKISLKFFSKVLIDNIPGLVEIMAYQQPGDKPLSESMIWNQLNTMI